MAKQAFSTTPQGTRGILIATEDLEPTGKSSTWAQVLDAKGAPIGDPVRIEMTTAAETLVGGIIGGLPGKTTDTTFRYF